MGTSTTEPGTPRLDHRHDHRARHDRRVHRHASRRRHGHGQQPGLTRASASCHRPGAGGRMRLMSQVPAATRALRVLRFLASQPDPVPLDRIMRACEPAAQHGVPPARRDDRRGLRRPPARRAPLRARASRRSRSAAATSARSRCSGSRAGRSPTSSTGSGRAPTSRCCTGATCSTSSRSARPGRPPLVTDVGVRLPAHLTASGRALLALLPAAAGAGALPLAARVRRPARPRPAHPRARCAGCSPRPGSGATPSRTARSPRAWPASPPRCVDHNGHPVAGVAVTYPEDDAVPGPPGGDALSREVLRTRRR